MPTDTGGDDDDFGVMGTANLVIPVSGTYEIGFRSDDGMSLQIVGQEWGEIVSNATGTGSIDGDTIVCDCLTGNSRTVATINLDAGTYEMVAVGFERGGGAYFEVFGAQSGSPFYAIIAKGTQDEIITVGPGGIPWVGPAQPTPTIFDVSLTDTEVMIDFTTPTPDSEHVLQESPTMETASWVESEATLEVLDGIENGFRFTTARPAAAENYYRIAVLPPPPFYSEDFESGAEGWVSNTTAGDTEWELGTPNVDNLMEAHSGENVYGTNLDGPYGNLVSASLRSPVIDLTDLGRPKLSFWYFNDTTFEAEGVQLRILDESGSPLFVREEIFWGTTPGWTQFEFTIPAEQRGIPIILEWLLLTDGDEPNGNGFYLDDVVVDD